MTTRMMACICRMIRKAKTIYSGGIGGGSLSYLVMNWMGNRKERYRPG